MMRKVSSKKTTSSQGFTLIEILITVAILSIVLGIGFLNLAGYKSRHTFDLDSESLVEGIRNAQTKARLREDGGGWGIRFTNAGQQGAYYEIFGGTEYATATVATREQLGNVTQIGDIAYGGSKTMLFSGGSGLPVSPLTLTLKRGAEKDAYIIQVSKIGVIGKQYEQKLLGYWALDEGEGTAIRDGSPSNHAGVVSQDTGWLEPTQCKSGFCMQMEEGTMITVPPSSKYLFSGDFAVSLWEKSVSGSPEGIFSVSGGDGNIDIGLNAGSAGVRAYWNGDGSLNRIKYGAVGDFSDGAWRHMLLSRSGDTITLYIDGVDRGSSTYAEALGSATGELWLGKDHQSGAVFSGALDDVRIYGRSFTEEQARALFESY